MPKKIINLSIDEVSPVDTPANGKEWLIIKRQDSERVEKVLETLQIDKATFDEIVDDMEARDKVYKYLDAFYSSLDSILWNDELALNEKINKLSTSLGQFKDKLGTISKSLANLIEEKEIVKSLKGGEDNMDWEEILAKMDEEVKKAVEDKIADMNKRIEELEKDEGEEGNNSSEDFDKSALPESVRKRLEAAEARAEKAEELAKAERDARRDVELKKTATNYKALGSVNDIVEVLKSAEEHDYKDEVLKVFDGVKERLEKADLFKEVGDSGDTSGDSEIEKRAQALMDEDTSLTKAKAITKVLERNPELYQDYLNG